jgi:hypothetical protein
MPAAARKTAVARTDDSAPSKSVDGRHHFSPSQRRISLVISSRPTVLLYRFSIPKFDVVSRVYRLLEETGVHSTVSFWGNGNMA